MQGGNTKAWEKGIRQVKPYVPGEQPKIEGMIKINTNENPYPPSPRIKASLEEFDTASLRLYPEPNNSSLAQALAKYYGREEKEVFVGVGSDDVLAMIFLTFFNGEKPILFPDITYSFYEVWAGLYRIPFEKQALDSDFRINKEDYYKENGGIVIANPNAPTGIYEELECLEDILKNNQSSILVVDEAYIDFGGKSAIHLLDKYDNLLVVQTFSKSRSMAGLRIGYCFGQEKLIQALNHVKHSYNSYTMNQVSMRCGIEALADKLYFDRIINKIIKTREAVKNSLEELGFYCMESSTNFLFVTHPSIKAVELFEMYKEKKVFVRYFNQPRIDNFLRITIGTEEEMEKFLFLTSEYLN